MGNEALWTYEDVAAYLRVSWKTVRKWANAKQIPVTKVRGQNRFDPDEIREWVEKQNVTEVN